MTDAEKVSKVRKRKYWRLKQVKEVVRTEIEKYKANREAQFHKNKVCYTGSKGQIASAIDNEAKARNSAKDASVAANIAKITSGLICIHSKYCPSAWMHLLLFSMIPL